MPGKDSAAQTSTQDAGRSPESRPSQPWRTEGLPKGQPPKRRPRWLILAVWFLGYVVFFGLLTVQDRMGGPQTIPYTEFKAQVANKNVGEVFARGNTIEGALKKAAPLPGGRQGEQGGTAGQGRTYQKFTTERPTFAADDFVGRAHGE
jgi:cell division protease FtsH